MNRETGYQSSIPENAREKITQRHGDKSRKQVEYYQDKELVGTREFHRNGILMDDPEGGGRALS